MSSRSGRDPCGPYAAASPGGKAPASTSVSIAASSSGPASSTAAAVVAPSSRSLSSAWYSRRSSASNACRATPTAAVWLVCACSTCCGLAPPATVGAAMPKSLAAPSAQRWFSPSTPVSKRSTSPANSVTAPDPTTAARASRAARCRTGSTAADSGASSMPSTSPCAPRCDAATACSTDSIGCTRSVSRDPAARMVAPGAEKWANGPGTGIPGAYGRAGSPGRDEARRRLRGCPA